MSIKIVLKDSKYFEMYSMHQISMKFLFLNYLQQNNKINLLKTSFV